MPTKKAKQDNAYHVKVKVIPEDLHIKSWFMQGIVLALTPKIAEDLAKEAIKQWAILEPINIDVTIHETRKLRKDFIIQAK